MDFQITVRHGSQIKRYLSLQVDAPDAVHALREAAELIPGELATEVDLVELRSAPDRPESMEPPQTVEEP
jgi:hypothetical protein